MPETITLPSPLEQALELVSAVLRGWVAWICLVERRRGVCGCARCARCLALAAVGASPIVQLAALCGLLEAVDADEDGPIRPCDCCDCIECLARHALASVAAAHQGQALPQKPCRKEAIGGHGLQKKRRSGGRPSIGLATLRNRLAHNPGLCERCTRHPAKYIDGKRLVCRYCHGVETRQKSCEASP